MPHVAGSGERVLSLGCPEVERRLREGETVERSGRTRDMNVVLPAAPTAVRLLELVRKSALLCSTSR